METGARSEATKDEQPANAIDLTTRPQFSRISDARTFRYSGLGGVVRGDDGEADQPEPTPMVTDQADDAGSEKAGKPSPLKSGKDGGER